MFLILFAHYNLAMEILNLPPYQFRLKKESSKMMIFDEIRRKFVVLTPEEWVRQNFVMYLRLHLGYPAQLMAIEMAVNVNGLRQRADVVVYNRKGAPSVIIECKATYVTITNEVFAQAARYNMNLKVNYLILSNGLKHYCAKLDYENNSYQILNEIPNFSQLQE
jgi:hypothetical protein